MANKYLFLLLITWLFFACQSTKQTSSNQQLSALSEKEEIAFGRAFLDGTKAKILGNYDEAVEHLALALKIDPKSAAAYYELGLVYNFQNNDEAAYQAFKLANDLDNNNFWYKLSYASFLEKKGDKEEAIKTFVELVDLKPNQLELRYELSKLLVGQGRYKEGIEALNEIEERIGVNEEISLLKQRIYLYQNNLDGAINEVNALITAFPDELKYKRTLADLYLSNGKDDEGLKVLREMEAIAPDSYHVQMALSDYYLKQNDREKYLIATKKAFENPDMDIDTKVKFVLRNYKIDSKNEELKKEGISLCYSISLAHPDDAKSHALYGDFLYFDEQDHLAADAYVKSIAIDSSKFPIWNQLLIILASKGESEKAVNYGKRGIDLFPNQASLYLITALQLNDLGQKEEALNYLDLGKDLVLSNPALKVQFYSSIGDINNDLKNFEKSDNAFEKAISIDPNNVFVLNNYSYYLSLRKVDLDKAEKLSLKANNLAPNQSSFLDTYAWIQFQKGNYELALEWINKAINASNKSAVLWEHKGDILYHLQKKEEAKLAWQKAAELGDGSDLLLKKIKEEKWYE